MIDHPRNPDWKVTPKMRDRARSLRRSSTNAEHIIWAAVRAHRMNGASFRRQAPLGPYVADLVCHDARLIIELDGGQHYSAAGEAQDARRDAFLAENGFRVLRFSNHGVVTDRQGVLEAIAAAVRGESPLADPPPQAGEGTQTLCDPYSKT